MATTKVPGPAVQCRLAELDYSVIDAPEAVSHGSVQGPVRFVRCACGWSAHSDDVNVYAAAEYHGLRLP